jgi:hypothetical protein
VAWDGPRSGRRLFPTRPDPAERGGDIMSIDLTALTSPALAAAAPDQRLSGVLLARFLASGIIGCICQISWLRILGFVHGITVCSVADLLPHLRCNDLKTCLNVTAILRSPYAPENPLQIDVYSHPSFYMQPNADHNNRQINHVSLREMTLVSVLPTYRAGRYPSSTQIKHKPRVTFLFTPPTFSFLCIFTPSTTRLAASGFHLLSARYPTVRQSDQSRNINPFPEGKLMGSGHLHVLQFGYQDRRKQSRQSQGLSDERLWSGGYE